MKICKTLAVYFMCIILAGCLMNLSTVQIHEPIKKPVSIKQLVLFLDGTQNDRNSRTNVSTLNEIIEHQDKDNLYTFYINGVGSNGDIVGAGTGLGNKERAVEAYLFLSEYYSAGSHIYMFGFSRGAYESRILAGMIDYLGIYDLKPFKKEDRKKIASELYDAANDLPPIVVPEASS